MNADGGRKVAIIGTAEPHWRNAPFADPTWEIWTCGGIFASAPRSDRHIEIHRLSETCRGWADTPEQEAASRNVYVEWLKGHGSSVYAQPTPELPAATAYPIDAVLEAFPDGYFTNTISYMIALALIEGVDELGLWGVDMALSSGVRESDEYGNQRPSCEFFLGVAIGNGIKVHLPPQSTLLKTRKLYGYGDDEGFEAVAQAKVDELSERAKQLGEMKRKFREQLIEAEMAEQSMKTALEVARYFKRNLA